MDRSVATDVVADVDGTLGLDVAVIVQMDQVDRLVTVSNHVGKDLTVTVTLQDGSQGDLYVDGINVGDTAVLAVADGASRDVDIESSANFEVIDFDTSASATGVGVTATGRQTFSWGCFFC